MVQLETDAFNWTVRFHWKLVCTVWPTNLSRVEPFLFIYLQNDEKIPRVYYTIAKTT